MSTGSGSPRLKLTVPGQQRDRSFRRKMYAAETAFLADRVTCLKPSIGRLPSDD